MPSSKASSKTSSLSSLSKSVVSKAKGLGKKIAKSIKSVVKGVVPHKSKASSEGNDTNDEPTSRLRSNVYQFFDPPVLREDANGRCNADT
ncbi:hypothetical protein R3P38DRAFT_3206202 [Favolaschia claudopus]|uniref:Uncharacterized protein n=1 Tax=Favolaschia claudopus TaxID=2862362 RepID=A0AAW0AP33_9AGAR